MVKSRHGFTLIEVLMVSGLIMTMFVAINSMLVMNVKRAIVTSYTEDAQLMCQRAALEINGYASQSAGMVILDSQGVVTAGPGNTLVLLDRYGNTNAQFSYVAGPTSTTGSMLITPYVAHSPQAEYDYGDQVSIPNGAAFWWTNGGFLAYAFVCNAATNNPATFQGTVMTPQ